MLRRSLTLCGSCLVEPEPERVLDFDRSSRNRTVDRAGPRDKLAPMIDFDTSTTPNGREISIHLAERTGSFLPTEPRARAAALQRRMYQMSHVGPIIGQTGAS